jgi:uncharacterized protein YcaQ
MLEITHSKDLLRLRRLALAAQGLLQAQPFGRGLSGARTAIGHISYVQIDTISVVERAHHHVLQSRVPAYKPVMLESMLRERDIFEYWSHAAAFLPMADFRFSLPYKEAIKNGQVHWYKDRNSKLMQELLARIRAEGPLRSRDIKDDRDKRAGWWDWKPAKKALEQLYMEGELMVSAREGFQKSYDLTERVLPAGMDTAMPTTEGFAAHLIERQLRCHGLVSLKGLTYLRRNAGLRQAVKAQLDAALASNELLQLRLSDGELFYVRPSDWEKALPRARKRILILSPFDNAVIQRERLKSLFQYDYQLECYLPEAKRQYGYFCLPLLYGSEFIGRMDCKAHRTKGLFEIKALFLSTSAQEEAQIVEAFADAVSAFAVFQGCHTVALRAVSPKRLAPALRQALKSREH